MLLWPIAAKAPSAIEAIAMKTMICCQSCSAPGKAPTKMRTVIAMAAIFGAEAKKAATGVGGALIDVRRPHVERHGRDLEGDAGGDEDEADDQADARDDRPSPPRRCRHSSPCR
jgi:hypothetical protein